jgi:uncharacterized membrane protein
MQGILAIILLVDIVITLVFYRKLPTQIAIHWNSERVPNGFSTRFWGAFSPIFIIIAIVLLDFFFSKVYEHSYVVEGATKIYSISAFILLSIVILVSAAQIVSLMWNTNYTINMAFIGDIISNIVICIIGFIFIAIGAFLKHTDTNAHVGFHIGPKVLSNDALKDDSIRKKVNRIDGNALEILGIVVVILSFIIGTDKLATIMTFIVLISSLAIVIFTYSYSESLYRRKLKKE